MRPVYRPRPLISCATKTTKTDSLLHRLWVASALEIRSDCKGHAGKTDRRGLARAFSGAQQLPLPNLFVEGLRYSEIRYRLHGPATLVRPISCAGHKRESPFAAGPGPIPAALGTERKSRYHSVRCRRGSPDKRGPPDQSEATRSNSKSKGSATRRLPASAVNGVIPKSR